MHGASHWQATPYTVPLGVGAGVFLVLGGYLLRHRTERRVVPGAVLGALLLFASGLWMSAYAVELVRTDLATKVLFNQIQYLGVAPLPLLWLAYVMRHTGVDDVPRPAWAALAAVPVVVAGLALTNQYHRLIWDGLWLSRTDGYVVLVNEHGIAFTGFIVYAYVLVLVGVGLLLRTFVRSEGIYRKQTVGLLVGGLLPAVAGVVYVAGWSPVPGLNLPALAFSAASGAVAWSVLRHRLFTLVPVAWESAVESMHEGAIVLDGGRAVVDANPVAAEYVRCPLDDAYGRPAAEVLPPELVAALDGEGSVETTVTLDGADRDVLVNASPLRAATGWSGALVLLRDITDRKERERRLERQNDRLEEFASVVSHDLRNPLTVARGYAELARETGDPDHFDRVDDAHQRMEAIIEDLLTLARQGETLTDVSPVAVGTVAREAWDGVASGDATLSVTVDETVAADRGRLRQLFENLFRNAVEHGSTGRQTWSGDAVEHAGAARGDDAAPVHVEVGPLDDGFYVEDDGSGIPEADRQRVFERGYTTHRDGTGFGLPIVRSVAEAHGWRVGLTESAAGGARFEFTDVRNAPAAEAADEVRARR